MPEIFFVAAGAGDVVVVLGLGYGRWSDGCMLMARSLLQSRWLLPSS